MAAAGGLRGRRRLSFGTRSVARGRHTGVSGSVAKCKTYDAAELVPTLDRMFDQIGGLGRIVKGKPSPSRSISPAPLLPAWLSAGRRHALHPSSRDRRRRPPDGKGRCAAHPHSGEPLGHRRSHGGSAPAGQLGAARYCSVRHPTWSSKIPTIWAAARIFAHDGAARRLHFSGFDLNHSYQDCDVFVSLAKMKEHATAGVTLSMKNCFGMTPATIYGAAPESTSLVSCPKADAIWCTAATASPPRARSRRRIRHRRARAAIACPAPSWI